MTSLKTTNRAQIEFLMDFDYNNVLGRLKFVLGVDSSLFANILVRNDYVIWSVRNDKVYIPLSEAEDATVVVVKNELKNRLNQLSVLISEDSLIGSYLSEIISYPSSEYVFYCQENGYLDIVLAGWGCKIQGEDSKVNLKVRKDEVHASEVETLDAKTDSGMKMESSYCLHEMMINSGTLESTKKLFSEEKNKRDEEKLKSATGWLIAIYIFASLGGWLGLVLGIYVYRNKKYKSSHRTLGLIGAILAILSIFLWKMALR